MASEDTAPATVNSKPSTDDEKRLYALNAATSFFSLPPEIRNKIYNLVLGNRDIHVFAKRDRVIHRICQSRASHRSRAEAAIRKGTEFKQRDWNRTHNLCIRGSESRKFQLWLRLDLLRVCRQIYDEASFVPYSSNTFVVEHDAALHNLAKTLTLKQRNAINKICITPSTYIDAEIDVPRQKSITRFGGLKHLTILGTIFSVRSPLGSIRERILRFIQEVTESLKGPAWSSVVVCFTSKGAHDRMGNLMVVDGEFRVESREMERVLLGSQKDGGHVTSKGEQGSSD